MDQWYSDASKNKEWLVAGAWDLCRNPLEGSKGVVRRYSIEVAIAVETGDVVGDRFSTSRVAKGNRGGKVARLKRVFPPARHRHPFLPDREVDRLVQKRLRGAVCAGAVEFAVPKIELGDLSQRVAVWQAHLTLPQQKRPPPPGRWFTIGDASQLPLRGALALSLSGFVPCPFSLRRCGYLPFTLLADGPVCERYVLHYSTLVIVSGPYF